MRYQLYTRCTHLKCSAIWSTMWSCWHVMASIATLFLSPKLRFGKKDVWHTNKQTHWNCNFYSSRIFSNISNNHWDIDQVGDVYRYGKLLSMLFSLRNYTSEFGKEKVYCFAKPRILYLQVESSVAEPPRYNGSALHKSMMTHRVTLSKYFQKIYCCMVSNFVYCRKITAVIPENWQLKV